MKNVQQKEDLVILLEEQAKRGMFEGDLFFEGELEIDK
jgi:hypothetical protein